MKRSLMASRSLRILVCVLLTLLLHAGPSAPVEVPTGVFAATAVTPSKFNNKVIRIWTVGSPHTNALPPAVVPPELRQRAESLGYTIEIEAFRPDGFATHFHQALQTRSEPEILTFDNYGVIIGMQTRLGWFQGIDWDHRTASSLAFVHETMSSLQPRGWVMLVRSALNYEAARTLAMRPPECDAWTGRAPNSPNSNPPNSGSPNSNRPNSASATSGSPNSGSPTITPALREAQEKAVLATRAYVDCDRSTLAGISDQSRMVQQCFQPQSDTKSESVKACTVSGNDKLAFVSLASSFSAVVNDPRALNPSKPGMDLGQKSILAVLTNQNGTWRVLAITHDAANTVARTPISTATFVNSLDPGPAIGITPEPARILTPNGVYPAAQNGERFGNFIWEPSPTPDVIGQVVEFMWGNDTNWGLTRLLFLRPTENKISSGFLMVGGTTNWRVWSVSKSGDVVFSQLHSFKHCPCPTVCGSWR